MATMGSPPGQGGAAPAAPLSSPSQLSEMPGSGCPGSRPRSWARGRPRPLQCRRRTPRWQTSFFCGGDSGGGGGGGRGEGGGGGGGGG